MLRVFKPSAAPRWPATRPSTNCSHVQQQLSVHEHQLELEWNCEGRVKRCTFRQNMHGATFEDTARTRLTNTQKKSLSKAHAHVHWGRSVQILSEFDGVNFGSSAWSVWSSVGYFAHNVHLRTWLAREGSRRVRGLPVSHQVILTFLKCWCPPWYRTVGGKVQLRVKTCGVTRNSVPMHKVYRELHKRHKLWWEWVKKVSSHAGRLHACGGESSGQAHACTWQAEVHENNQATDNELESQHRPHISYNWAIKIIYRSLAQGYEWRSQSLWHDPPPQLKWHMCAWYAEVHAVHQPISFNAHVVFQPFKNLRPHICLALVSFSFLLLPFAHLRSWFPWSWLQQKVLFWQRGLLLQKNSLCPSHRQQPCTTAICDLMQWDYTTSAVSSNMKSKSATVHSLTSNCTLHICRYFTCGISQLFHSSVFNMWHSSVFNMWHSSVLNMWRKNSCCALVHSEHILNADSCNICDI